MPEDREESRRGDKEYREQIRKFTEADRDRKARAETESQVKFQTLKSRMPWGCWVWLGLVAILGYAVIKWILNKNWHILPLG